MAMAVTTATIALQALFLILITLPSFSLSKPGGGIVLSLIHRDSPGSPFYNPNATRAELWKSAWHRSSLRHNYIQSALTAGANYSPQDGGISPISRSHSEIITKLIIGTPPVAVSGAIDTGSGMVWVYCLPCKECSNETDTAFDPSLSFTYQKVDCETLRCDDFPDAGNCSSDGKCTYKVGYLDGAYSKGILSLDNFTFTTLDHEEVSYPYSVFGCSSEAGGNIVSEGVGIIGLSRGPYSLIGQLGIQMKWQFSYCVGPRKYDDGDSGNLILGEGAIFLGHPTPIDTIRSTNGDGVFYVLNLVDITVGGSDKLGIMSGTSRPTVIGEGGIVVDSGSTFTYLENYAFYKLLKKLKDVIKLTLTPDPFSKLCYEGTVKDLTERNIPVITFNFLNLDVDLSPTNTFTPAGNARICLTMEPTEWIPIFGNIAQRNLNLGFDMENQKLYIAPTSCN